VDGGGGQRRLRQVLGLHTCHHPECRPRGAGQGRAGDHSSRRGISAGVRAVAAGVHPSARLRRPVVRQHPPWAPAARDPTRKCAAGRSPRTAARTQTGNGGCSGAGRCVPRHPGRYPRRDHGRPDLTGDVGAHPGRSDRGGLPDVDVLPLFDEPAHVAVPGVDDFPADLFAVAPLPACGWPRQKRSRCSTSKKSGQDGPVSRGPVPVSSPSRRGAHPPKAAGAGRRLAAAGSAQRIRRSVQCQDRPWRLYHQTSNVCTG